MPLLQIHEPGQTPEPHSRARAVGIDLGTTHSVVSVMKGGAAVSLEDAEGHSIVPSAVYIAGDDVSVGHKAFRDAKAHHTYPLQSIKRMMGRNTAEVKQLFKELAEHMVSDDDTLPTLIISGKEYNPISLSAHILSHMKAMAETALQERITQAVITVPAYFDDAARHATQQAATLAGLEVLRLINEPTAAALAYGLEHHSEGLYAIYDLGGGTFDVSLLNLDKGIFQVLATAGDTHLGGDDVDRAIADHLKSTYGLTSDAAHLHADARMLKEQLSTASQAELVHNDIKIALNREQLAKIAAPLIARTLAICDAALRDAGVTANALDGVVMVGGSTRLLAVQEAVATHFNVPIFNNIDPDRVVSYGAAIQAHALTQGAEHLLLDVTPLSLGLETMGGIVEKIIYRNTAIPAKASQQFTTFKDGQTAMQIHVVQGEREMVDQCRSLAQFELTGIPPLPAGIARIDVQFMIDADGLLTVSAEELHTNTKQTIIVKPSYGLDISDIERMIISSMEHGRQDIMQRLMAEAKMEALRTIEELRSAMKHDSHLLSAEELQHIEQAIARLADAEQGDDRDAIDMHHDALKAAITPFAERRMNYAVKKALAGNHVADIKGVN
jgi:molecular chaperone HscA